MDWKTITLVALISLAVLLKVGSIGKPREPITPGDAVVVILLGIFQIWLIVS